MYLHLLLQKNLEVLNINIYKGVPKSKVLKGGGERKA